MNRNHFEYVGKIFNVKERKTQRGWMYTFAVPIDGQDKAGEELSLWMNGVIFTKDREILPDRCTAHFTAKLTVNAPYGDRPANMGFVGYEVRQVFGKVYKVSKPKAGKERSSQAPQPSQSPQPYQPPLPQQPYQPQNPTTLEDHRPARQLDGEELDDGEVPF